MSKWDKFGKCGVKYKLKPLISVKERKELQKTMNKVCPMVKSKYVDRRGG